MSNLEAIHNPPDSFEKVIDWFHKGQVDYTDYFLKLYIAYNAWYGQVVGTTNDRQALAALKKRFVIWSDYTSGRTLQRLGLYAEQLADLTQREPLRCSTAHWNGELANKHDWRSLIEYWYQVRCTLVHGGDIDDTYVWLAYETLNIFMSEIMKRVAACLRGAKADEIKQLAVESKKYPGGSEKFQQIQKKLYQKYVAMPDIWQVDMQRVPESP